MLSLFKLQEQLNYRTYDAHVRCYHNRLLNKTMLNFTNACKVAGKQLSKAFEESRKRMRQ